MIKKHIFHPVLSENNLPFEIDLKINLKIGVAYYNDNIFLTYMRCIINLK